MRWIGRKNGWPSRTSPKYASGCAVYVCGPFALSFVQRAHDEHRHLAAGQVVVDAKPAVAVADR